MAETKKTKKKIKDYSLGIGIGSLIIVIILWGVNYYYGMKLDPESDVTRGVFGDMFGAVNAVFSGLAFAGIILSLYMQRIELKLQRKELKLTRKEVKQTNEEFHLQNRTMEIQKFENQYYKMIDLHKANVDEMKITFFDHVKVPYNSPQGNDHHNQEILRDVSGRKIFVGMLAEFNAIYLSFSKVVKRMQLDLDNNAICSYSYQLFFFGIKSKKNDFGNSKPSLKTNVIKALKILQHDFYEKRLNERKSKSDNDFSLKFYPFEGHESRLAHYYRHLFQTVKYVVQQEDRKLITYDESRQYLRVLRAQLSNAEQVLLYYNYLADFGSNWDYIGKKGYQFLTRYRMIHNIPFDNIANGIENPREHFKDYIASIDSNVDPLFEWGDYD